MAGRDAFAGPRPRSAVDSDTMSAKEIIEAALKLDPIERARVAHELLDSLEAAPEEDAERLWNEELASPPETK